MRELREAQILKKEYDNHKNVRCDIMITNTAINHK